MKTLTKRFTDVHQANLFIKRTENITVLSLNTISGKEVLRYTIKDTSNIWGVTFYR